MDRPYRFAAAVPCFAAGILLALYALTQVLAAIVDGFRFDPIATTILRLILAGVTLAIAAVNWKLATLIHGHAIEPITPTTTRHIKPLEPTPNWMLKETK